jgi:hypothetical protein
VDDYVQETADEQAEQAGNQGWTEQARGGEE